MSAPLTFPAFSTGGPGTGPLPTAGTTRPGGPGAAGSARGPRTGRRRSPLLLAGVLLATLGMLGGWLVYQQADARVPVVAVARPVAFGQEITAADVRQALLPPGTDVSSVAWADLDQVVGRLAATDLAVGQLLTADAVREQLIPEPGEAVVGMPVGPGQLPSMPLRPRDEVLVIRADGAGSTVRATVLQVGGADSTGRRTVDLLVTDGQVPVLARAATEQQTLLVLIARR